MEKIGITSTIPVEVLIAGGYQPVDLNNIFITSEKSSKYINEAEKIGFPRTCCSWIKGIYSACLDNKINKVVALTQGDCSNTQALMEILQLMGIEVIPFGYPFNKDIDQLRSEIEKLASYFNTSMSAVKETKKYLDNLIRIKLRKIDQYTYRENIVTGKENHTYLINSSDFNGDPKKYSKEIDAFIKEIRKRDPMKHKIRLAYIGIPPIFTDIYDYLDSLGAHVVFNEVQRQFSMPYDTNDIIYQYICYTYPYSIFGRLDDIRSEIEKRKVHGVINYVQTFCYRHIQDIVLRKKLRLPFLTIEGDKPGELDARTKIRIETFIQMIKQNI